MPLRRVTTGAHFDTVWPLLAPAVGVADRGPEGPVAGSVPQGSRLSVLGTGGRRATRRGCRGALWGSGGDHARGRRAGRARTGLWRGADSQPLAFVSGRHHVVRRNRRRRRRILPASRFFRQGLAAEISRSHTLRMHREKARAEWERGCRRVGNWATSPPRPFGRPRGGENSP